MLEETKRVAYFLLTPQGELQVQTAADWCLPGPLSRPREPTRQPLTFPRIPLPGRGGGVVKIALLEVPSSD